MSAMAFAPPDIAGLSTSTGRKWPTATPQDDGDANFGAALAQIADATPAAEAEQQAVPVGIASAKTDAAIWQELVALSGATTRAADADAETPARQTSEAGEAKSPVPPDRMAIDLPRETAGENGPRLPLGKAAADADLPATSEKIAESGDGARAPDRAHATTEAQKTPDKRAAAPKIETPAPAPAPAPPCDLSAITSSPAPLVLPEANAPARAVSVAAPAAPPSHSGGAVSASDAAVLQDAVARIGAALAGTGAAPRVRALDSDQDKTPKAPSDAGATVSVRVASQKTWLPPVSPPPSPALHALASDPTEPQSPGAPADATTPARTLAVGLGEKASGAKNADAEAKAASPGAARDVPIAKPVAEASPAVAAMAQPDAASAGKDNGPKAPGVAASPAASTPVAPAPAPRRDLEITLAPKELGGLEVRMKSAGDRLALTFVTERGETARMISDKSVALTSQLHGAGIGLGGVDISAAAMGQGGGDATAGGGRQTQTQPQAEAGGDSAPSQSQSQTPSGRDRQERKDETPDQTADPRSRGDRGLYL
jgi:flagellar hook-length control protein FliK